MNIQKDNEGYAEGEETLHFYYNREERLARAPKNVQDYYAGKSLQFSKNIFKIMFARKENRFMFIFLVLFIAFAWIMTALKNKADNMIQGIPVTFTAFSYEGEVYSSFTLNEIEKSNSKNEITLPVVVAGNMYAVDKDEVLSEPWAFSELYDGKQLFIRTKFTDYDIIQVRAEITILEEKKVFSANIKRL